MLYNMGVCLTSSSTEYAIGVSILHNKKFCIKSNVIVAVKPTLPWTGNLKSGSDKVLGSSLGV